MHSCAEESEKLLQQVHVLSHLELFDKQQLTYIQGKVFRENAA